MKALELMDRAERLIGEQNPPDDSPLTTAERDLREARRELDKLILSAKRVVLAAIADPKISDTNPTWLAIRAMREDLHNIGGY
jgi:hypothetical protein